MDGRAQLTDPDCNEELNKPTRPDLYHASDELCAATSTKRTGVSEI
jgi:hypothetical protein